MYIKWTKVFCLPFKVLWSYRGKVKWKISAFDNDTVMIYNDNRIDITQIKPHICVHLHISYIRISVTWKRCDSWRTQLLLFLHEIQFLWIIYKIMQWNECIHKNIRSMGSCRHLLTNSLNTNFTFTVEK